MGLISKDVEWKPHIKQEKFLALPYTIREALYGGGAGSGKSDVLLLYPIVHRWHENPRFKQVFLRRTHPELEREIVPRSKNIYHKFGGRFNSSKMHWTFPSGAMVFLGHCEHEDDVHMYDSMEINLFTPDEITSLSESIYTYIGFTRLRSSDPNLPAIIRAAGMPGDIGHSWVKRRFIDPVPPGTVMKDRLSGLKRVYIHATVLDNPNADPNYVQMLKAIPSEAERKAKLEGSWESYLGQVFDEFREYRNSDEPENALHVVDPFDIPDFWPRIVVGDWGFNAMTYVLYLAISPDRRVYAYREQHWYKTKIEEWAPFVKHYVDLEKPKTVKFCRSVSKDKGSEMTIQQQIENALGMSIELSDHSQGSRISGKLLVHEYLRWQQRTVPSKNLKEYNEQHAQALARRGSFQEFAAYLKSFEKPAPELNLPKLQIFKQDKIKEQGCPLLIQAIKAAAYAKTNKPGKVMEDVAEFQGDDPYDTLRYGLDSIDRYFSESEHEFNKILSQQQLINELQLSGDMTAFYRQAERMERSGEYGDYQRPVIRHSRLRR